MNSGNGLITMHTMYRIACQSRNGSLCENKYRMVVKAITYINLPYDMVNHAYLVYLPNDEELTIHYHLVTSFGKWPMSIINTSQGLTILCSLVLCVYYIAHSITMKGREDMFIGTNGHRLNSLNKYIIQITVIVVLEVCLAILTG